MCLCNGILFSHKNEILPFATTQMDAEGIRLSEISQKSKYCKISLNMKSQNDTDIKNKLVVISGERKVRRGKKEVGIKRSLNKKAPRMYCTTQGI